MGSPERTVRSVWGGGYRCTVTTGEFVLEVDEPVSVGGTGVAPQPTELLLASIASCFTLAMSHSAAKRGIEIADLEVEVTGVYDGPSFRNIEIVVSLDCPAPVGERLLEAAQRVCYVTNTLRNEPGISVRLA